MNVATIFNLILLRLLQLTSIFLTAVESTEESKNIKRNLYFPHSHMGGSIDCFIINQTRMANYNGSNELSAVPL